MKASRLIQMLANEIANKGDMEVKVEIDCNKLKSVSGVEKMPKEDFMKIVLSIREE